MRNLTLFFIASLFVLASCSTEKRFSRKCSKVQFKYEKSCLKWHCPSVKDSTFSSSTVIIRDTTIFLQVPGEIVHDSIPLIVSEGIYNSHLNTLETTFALSKAWVQNGVLMHTLFQKASAIPQLIPGALQTSTSTITKTIKVPYYVNRSVAIPIRWWQKFLIWSGILFWLVLMVLAITRFTKFY